ncbi:hypothetical protein CFC21_088099 [Triticum aestivum]|uniref:Uncharacterized protein n=2 Tax=Triticum aestivum TaxID=4565 RepID=A0A3B6PKX2_WHEAT|nr:uncharacterized protein LOC123137091 isoform X1 [Triticum aestivum]KAF7084489.1 hypothetical protein CFC21_088099 [Triticum aestivum]
MQYHHRSRLPPPPPPPFGRGSGAVYPGGHKQLYAPQTPPRPPLLAPPHRRYEVLMEAGRLAAEYLVSTGVLPPSSLQRGGGDPWAVPPPPLPQPRQEPPAFYDWRRYDDVYSNNPGTRPRRNSSITSCCTNRDDYSNGGSYNGRWKRKYGEYRMGYPGRGREREEERARSNSNGRRYEEDKDEDGAPGFQRDRRSSVENDESRRCVTDEVKEAAPFMEKAVGQLEMKDTGLNADVRKNADALLELQAENEGEMKENKILSSELEMDPNGDVNNTSIVVVMEADAKLLPDGKVVGEKAEDNNKVLCDRIALNDDMKILENGLHVDRRSLLKHYDFAKAPTKPSSCHAHRKLVTETVDLVSSREGSQMVADEAANERSLTNIQPYNREDQIYQESTVSKTAYKEITMEPMLLQENKTLVVTENMREYKNDAQLHVVQEYKEEQDVSSLTISQKHNLMQENDLSPLSASRKGGLMQETNLSTLTGTQEDIMIEDANLSPLPDAHNDSLIAETNLSPMADAHNDSLIEESDQSPSTASHEVTLMQETDITQSLSLHKNNLNLQFKKGAQICDTEIVPKEVGLFEFSDQKNIVGADLFCNAGAETIIQMEEEEKLDQSSSFRTPNNPGFGQHSARGYSVEPHKQLQEDFGANVGDIVGGTNNLCQVSLDNNSVQVFDIEDDMPIEGAGFDSSKAKNEMICSSMDVIMHPGIHTDDLPVIEDGYNLALSDYLAADIPCYTSLRPDLQAGICTNDSEGIPVMDDPIYGSLTDIGFMDVWSQPAEDFEKFF